MSLTASSPVLDNMQSCPMGTPPMEEYPGGTPTTRLGWFHEVHRLLRASPLFQPILEDPPTTSFALASASTPYGPWERCTGSEHPSTPPSKEASCIFMAPLSHIMHPRSAALCTPSQGEAPVSFSCSLHPLPKPLSNHRGTPNRINSG